MDTLKEYAQDFIEDESGMEILQSAGIIVVSVLLLAILFVLGNSIYGYIESAAEISDDTFSEALELGGNAGN